MNPELRQALVLEFEKPAKNASSMGRGTVPATPPCDGSAKLFPFSARFTCEFWSCWRKPFSKMLT